MDDMRAQYIKKINGIDSWSDYSYDYLKYDKKQRKYAKKVARKNLKKGIDKEFAEWYNEYIEKRWTRWIGKKY